LEKHDFEKFKTLLSEVHAFYSREITAFSTSVWWEAMRPFGYVDVERALLAHIARPDAGKFLPKPADILPLLGVTAVPDAPDAGRPGPEEAWASAAAGFDEAETIVTNDEIAEAMGMARPILDLGDEVGARMAFREAYARIVREARGRGVANPRWWPSLGHDPGLRQTALSRAVERGLLTGEQVAGFLPAPAPVTPQGAAIAGLLSGKVVEMPRDPEFRRRIAALRDVLKGKAKAAA
jgi:hypothetical protein